MSRILAACALVAVAAAAVLGPAATPALRGALAGVSALLALASFAAAAPAARSVTTLLALAALAGLTGLVWQLAMLLTVGAFLGLAALVPALAPSSAWRARGALPWAGIALVAGVTPLALVGWVLTLRPDLRDVVATYGLRDHPVALLIAGAALFALVNALLEEAIWRGLLQDRLAVLFGPTLAILLQGASFGLQHWHGVPRGPIGALLAGGWGVMLGVLRRRARGLAAPVIAHVVADAVIAAIVLALYR